MIGCRRDTLLTYIIIDASEAYLVKQTRRKHFNKYFETSLSISDLALDRSNWIDYVKD
jgi:hypothetical protein